MKKYERPVLFTFEGGSASGGNVACSTGATLAGSCGSGGVTTGSCGSGTWASSGCGNGSRAGATATQCAAGGTPSCGHGLGRRRRLVRRASPTEHTPRSAFEARILRRTNETNVNQWNTFRTPIELPIEPMKPIEPIEPMKQGFSLNTIYFYLTEGCNLACRHCWIAPKFQGGGKSYPALSVELFKSIIQQAKPLGLSRSEAYRW